MRALKWPKNHSNAAAITALEVLSIRCRPLVMKLHGFPVVVVESGSVSLSGWVLQVFCNDVESVFSEGVFHAAQPRFTIGYICNITFEIICFLIISQESELVVTAWTYQKGKYQTVNAVVFSYDNISFWYPNHSKSYNGLQL